MKGQVTCLLGLSGAGKSTLMNVILGLAPGRFHGKVTFSHEHKLFTSKEIRLMGLAAVLTQNAALVPWLTISRNLALPAQLNTHLKPPNQDDITAILVKLNLSLKDLNREPHVLSDGMRQRLAFARVLLYKPQFLFLDEVFASLDTVNADDLETLLTDYITQSEATCVLISHDIHRSLRLGQSVVYLDQQKLLKSLPRGVVAGELINLMRADRSGQSTPHEIMEVI